MDQSLRYRLISWSMQQLLTASRTRLILQAFEPLESVLTAPAATFQSLLKLETAEAEKWTRTADSSNYSGELVTYVDSDYPPQLREVVDPPLVLYLRGRRDLLQRPGVAFVGSRRASTYGINAAQHLVSELAGSVPWIEVEAIAALTPDYLKVTKALVSTLFRESIKRDLVTMLVDLAHKIGAKTLAEGIETVEEYETCRELGIDLIQGYFFAHPQAQVESGDAEVAQSVGALARRA